MNNMIFGCMKDSKLERAYLSGFITPSTIQKSLRCENTVDPVLCGNPVVWDFRYVVTCF